MQLNDLAKQFLHQHTREEKITALAMTVQTPKHAQAINIYAGAANQQHNLFQAGSICKSFITAILLKLASNPKNHFSINDPVTKFFPGYTKWHAVTIKELMNMTSGIPDYFSEPDLIANYSQHPFQANNPGNWIVRMYSRSLLFKPGTQFNYSNTNYFILGMIIEKITRQPLQQVITNMLIKPLGLGHTYFVPNTPSTSLRKQLVHGYQTQDGFIDYIPRGTDVTKYSLTYLGAAGAIVSNSTDISTWIRALFTPGQVLSKQEFQQMVSLISQKSGRPLAAPNSQDPNAFGLGIGVTYGENLKTAIYIYQGITLGYRTMYVYVPSQHTSIVVTVNSDFTSKKNHLTDLINHVGKIIL